MNMAHSPTFVRLCSLESERCQVAGCSASNSEGSLAALICGNVCDAVFKAKAF